MSTRFGTTEFSYLIVNDLTIKTQGAPCKAQWGEKKSMDKHCLDS